MVKATAQLLPDAIRLVQVLIERFGSVGEVRAELRRIQDHGARLDAAEAELDARMAAAEQKRRGDDP